MKIKKILFTILVFFSCVTYSFAFATGDEFKHTYGSEGTLISPKPTQAYYWEHGTGTRGYVGITHGAENTKSGAKYTAYCIDGWRVTSTSNLKVASNSDILKTNGKDLALLYMLNYGNYTYVQRLIAIRAFIPFGRFFSKTKNIDTTKNDNDYTQVHANYRSGFFWLVEKDSNYPKNRENVVKLFELQSSGDSEVRTKIASIAKQKGYDVYNPYSGLKLNNSSDNTKYRLNGSNADVKKAKKLFMDAIDYAANYAARSTVKGEVAFTEPVIDKNSLKDTGGNNKEGTVTFQATFKNLSSISNPLYIVINPDANKNVTVVSSYYSTDNKTWKSFQSNTDLKGIIKNTTGSNIKLYFKVNLKSTNGKNANISFKTEAKFTREGEYSGTLITPKSDGANKQRFFIGGGASNPDNTGDSKTTTIPWPGQTTKVKCPSTLPTKGTTDYNNYIKSDGCCWHATASSRGGSSAEGQCTQAIKNERAFLQQTIEAKRVNGGQKISADEEKKLLNAKEAEVRTSNKWCVFFYSNCKTKTKCPDTLPKVGSVDYYLYLNSDDGCCWHATASKRGGKSAQGQCDKVISDAKKEALKVLKKSKESDLTNAEKKIYNNYVNNAKNASEWCQFYNSYCNPSNKCPDTLPSKGTTEFKTYIDKNSPDGCCYHEKATLKGGKSAEGQCENAVGKSWNGIYGIENQVEAAVSTMKTNTWCKFYFANCNTHCPDTLPAKGTSEYDEYTSPSGCCWHSVASVKGGKSAQGQCDAARKNNDQAGINKWCTFYENDCKDGTEVKSCPSTIPDKDREPTKWNDFVKNCCYISNDPENSLEAKCEKAKNEKGDKILDPVGRAVTKEEVNKTNSICVSYNKYCLKNLCTKIIPADGTAEYNEYVKKGTGCCTKTDVTNRNKKGEVSAQEICEDKLNKYTDAERKRACEVYNKDCIETCPVKIPGEGTVEFEEYKTKPTGCCFKSSGKPGSAEEMCEKALAGKSEAEKEILKQTNEWCNTYYNKCEAPYICKTEIPNKNNTDEFKSYLKTCCRKDNSWSITKECKKAKNDPNNEWCKLEAEYCHYCDGTVSVATQCSDLSTDGQIPACKGNVDAVIKDSDDAKICVVDYDDESGNPHKLSNVDSVKSNPYCNVYCKEDYKVSLPLGRWVDPGRSFTLLTNVTGTKTCYTDLINYDKFISDLNNARATLKAGSGNNKNEIQKYNNIINQYNACANASWDSKIKFDPDISLTYDEDEYMNKIKKTGKIQLKKVTTGQDKNGNKVNVATSSNNNVWLCNSTNVDNYYNVCGNNSAATSKPSDIQVKLNDQLTCDTDGNCQAGLNIAATRYAKKVSTESAIYVPELIFVTQIGQGIVQLKSETSGKTWIPLATKITDDSITISDSGGLPVALKRETGFYKYKIKFSNIGEFFNANKKYGRLVGDKNSVAKTNKGTTFEGEYLCKYAVNCIGCKVTCNDKPEEGYFCVIDKSYTIPGNPGITEECRNCKVTSFTDNEGKRVQLYAPRVTSTEKVVPEGRNAGYNLSTPKGEQAVSEIESKGESIYASTPEFSIVLEPKTTNAIKKYNETHPYSSFDDFDCELYSEYKKTKDPKVLEKIKESDYNICELGNNLKQLFGDKFTINVVHSSWTESCSNGQTCNTKGVTGPAYK